MKIAITGATGQLGRIVVSKLKEKVSADNIVALVRSVQKAADLVWKQEKAFDCSELLLYKTFRKNVHLRLLTAKSHFLRHGHFAFFPTIITSTREKN